MTLILPPLLRLAESLLVSTNTTCKLNSVTSELMCAACSPIHLKDA